MILKEWREIIERAEKRGMFLIYDKTKAGDWETCAIGEKHHFKTILSKLSVSEKTKGSEFEEAIYKDDIKMAKSILKEIEELP